MKKFNYHSHTTYSDGKKKPEEYVHAAIKNGLEAFGFSDHAPIDFQCNWTMNLENLPSYVKEINDLKNQFKDQVELYCGMEVDYIPGVISIESSYIKDAGLDYTIGAVHFVDQFPDGAPWAVDANENVFRAGVNSIFGGSVEKALRRYFSIVREMVQETKPDIVAHLDRFKKNNIDRSFYEESMDWYQEEIRHTLDVIAESGCIMEVNTKSIYKGFDQPYPSDWVIQEAFKRNVPIHLGADAHHPELITGGFDKAIQMIEVAGYKELRILKGGEWMDVAME